MQQTALARSRRKRVPPNAPAPANDADDALEAALGIRIIRGRQ
jgi:hypothetical protein